MDDDRYEETKSKNEVENNIPKDVEMIKPTEEERWANYDRRIRNQGKIHPILEDTIKNYYNDFQGKAVELGAGCGLDTEFLAKNGWNITAISNSTTIILESIKKLEENIQKNITIKNEDFRDLNLQDNLDLVIAFDSIPFVPSDEFDRLWQKIEKALKPGGRFVGTIFGNKHSWNKNEKSSKQMTFKTKEELKGLFSDFEIESIREIEKDNHGNKGTVHWHLFEIVAKKK